MTEQTGTLPSKKSKKKAKKVSFNFDEDLDVNYDVDKASLKKTLEKFANSMFETEKNNKNTGKVLDSIMPARNNKEKEETIQDLSGMIKMDVRGNKADQDYLEHSMFAGAHNPATETLAVLSWQKFVRTKEDIRAELEKSLIRCKTFFGNVGIPFKYYIGDSDFKRRELREGWRERRSTGVITCEMEQDTFVIDDENVSEDGNNTVYKDFLQETKKIAHRGKMKNMIDDYSKRMTTRLQGLEEMEQWMNFLKAQQSLDDPNLELEDLDYFLEFSLNEFTESNIVAINMVKQMRRLLRKMGDKHRMLQNRMKVTSKLKERAGAAMANKSIKVDYTNLQTINGSFDQILNRQLVFLTLNKRLSKEAQENDERLRKIQIHMTRCVKELSEDKEKLFHKNHLLSNDNAKLNERLKLLTEEVEFYQNKEGLLKHEANVEATKTVEALKIELGDLSQRHEKLGKEEEALRNEVQDLHEQVLKHEVEQGGILRHLEEAEETIKTLKHKINDEKRRCAELGEECQQLKEENNALRMPVETQVADKTTSVQSLDCPRIPVSTDSEELIEEAAEVINYVERVVEKQEAATDTWDLIIEMELTKSVALQTDPVEFAEDKAKGLTNPFETDLMKGNMNFLNTVQNKSNKQHSQNDDNQGSKVHRARVVDTPGYTQMIIKRLKEERENDIAKLGDYIKREKGRTEATGRKLTKEHKRAMDALRREIRAIVLAIVRYRDKFSTHLAKQGVTTEGLINPTVIDIKNDKNEKTTVSLKHTAVEMLNCIDFNMSVGLKEIHIMVKESLTNQKNTERELAVKNKRLEKTNKAVSTLESRIAQLKRDSERLRIREHYTNERYKELLKREEDLERAEEAHVARIENRLSELWSKSATDIEEGLDDILTVKKTNIKKVTTRPHRPKDRMQNTSDIFVKQPSPTKSLQMIESEEEYSSEDEEEEEEETAEEFNKVDAPKMEINNVKSEVSNKNLEIENFQEPQQPKGTLHKGNPIVAHYVHKVDKEWNTAHKTEELKQYMEDNSTIKPATIIHPGDGKFLHFDSSVAKIDDMYQTIVNGKRNCRKRREAVRETDTTILHYNERPVAEMQLTILASDQVYNIGVLRNAYENKAIGIRFYSNSLDLMRRNLSLKESRLKLLSERMLQVKNLAAVETMLRENEEVGSMVVEGVLDRLPGLLTQHTQRYQEKVRKLIRLNTYILAEQVRVFQTIRDCDLTMRLRFPFPIMGEDKNKIYFEPPAVKSQVSIAKRKIPLRQGIKVVYPAPMGAILTARSALNKSPNNKRRMALWRNPTLTNAEFTNSEPVPYTLLLDCNTLRPHTDVNLPMTKLNPHKTIPPIKEEEEPTSFTLPLVNCYSTADSGYDGSNVVLDPTKYM